MSMTDTSDRNTKFLLQAAKKAKFVEAFAACGVIQPALDAADIGRTTYKRWRTDDEDFAEACQDAYETAVDRAEVELRRRGVEGFEEPVLFKGSPVWKMDPGTGERLLDADFNPVPYTITRYSDRLLEVYTRSHRSQYKERSEVAITGPNGGAVKHDIKVQYVLPKGKTVEDYEVPDDMDFLR